ncbi:unnamed protein product, partial [Urochloa humidicola]
KKKTKSREGEGREKMAYAGSPATERGRGILLAGDPKTDSMRR